MAELKPIVSEPGTPLYAQTREAIRRAVDQGILSPGEQLPSTKALSNRLGVSLVTVHRALQELVAAGVLRRGQGRGTFVHESYHERRDTTAGVRLGVVLHQESSLADSYHGQIFEGVRREATDRGIDLVLLRFGEDWRQECGGYLYVNAMPSQIERPPRFSSKRNASQSPGNGPVIALGARFEQPGIGWVDTDNLTIGRIAADHLAALGKDRLVYLGDGSELSNSRDRWLGFTRTCAERGYAFDPETDAIRVSDWRLSDAAETDFRRRLAQDSDVAVFAAGYYFALGAYKVCSELGLRVGEDVPVLGVDDPPSAAYLSPSLSTVSQPLIEMGCLAVRQVLHAIETGGTPSRVTLEPELIVRDSTGGESRGNHRKTVRTMR